MNQSVSVYEADDGPNSERTLKIVAFGEGEGECRYERSRSQEGKGFTLVRCSDDLPMRRLQHRELIKALEELFNQGAVAVEFKNGDAILTFASSFLEEKSREDFVEQAKILAANSREIIFKTVAQPKASDSRSTLGIICGMLVTAIAILSFLLTESASPVEISKLLSICSILAAFPAYAFIKFTKPLIQFRGMSKWTFICSLFIAAVVFLDLLAIAINYWADNSPAQVVQLEIVDLGPPRPDFQYAEAAFIDRPKLTASIQIPSAWNSRIGDTLSAIRHRGGMGFQYLQNIERTKISDNADMMRFSGEK